MIIKYKQGDVVEQIASGKNMIQHVETTGFGSGGGYSAVYVYDGVFEQISPNTTRCGTSNGFTYPVQFEWDAEPNQVLMTVFGDDIGGGRVWRKLYHTGSHYAWYSVEYEVNGEEMYASFHVFGTNNQYTIVNEIADKLGISSIKIKHCSAI